ncbi:MAG: fibronectin type III domain-containing protein, partial [Halanaerobiales bacterium]|nr:fibronectin type III domain-containing protein [Halanaerobiales bacterium]
MHYKVLVVDETPSIPIVQSDTHTANASSFYTQAHFYWNTPSAGNKGIVGITVYEYVLKKIIGDQEEIIVSNSTKLNEVIFSNLSPLQFNEGYYLFTLRAVNSAGRKSEYSTFKFNIDEISSTSIISVISDTHPSNYKYYNNDNIYLSWNNPGDLESMEYYYQFGLDEIYDKMDWIPINEQEKQIVVDNKKSGIYEFKVKGVHSNDILYSNVRKINLDFNSPGISSFTLTLNLLENKVAVYWGNVSDLGGSGIIEIKVHLYNEKADLTIDERGWFSCNASEGELLIDSIQPDLNYILELEARDQAGNRRVKVAKFNLLTGVEYSVGETFDLYLNNWQISGTTYDGFVQESKVISPNDFMFKIKTEDSFTVVEEIPFVEGELIGDYSFAGRNDQLEYQVNLSGYVLNGKGVYINLTGFYLEKVWIDTSESFWYDDLGQEIEDNKKVIFENVELTSLGGNKVIGKYLDKKNSCTYYGNWHYNVDEFRFDENALSIFGTVDLTNAYVDNPLLFAGLKLSPNLELSSVQLTGDYLIILPDNNVLIVKESELELNRLVVKHAEYTIHSDEGETTIEIGNFAIDYFGTIDHLEDFYSQATTFSYGGVTYTIPDNSLGFEGNNLYMFNGEGTVPGSTEKIPVSYVPINNQGEILIPQGKYFTHIEDDINGILIEASWGAQDGEYIIFEEGTIYLPITDGFGKLVKLELRNLSYGANGFDFSNISIYTPYFNYNQLGTIQVTSIQPDEIGLTLNGKIQLGSTMPDGLRYRTLRLQPFVVTVENGISDNLLAEIPTTAPLIINDTLEFSSGYLNFRDDEVKSIFIDEGYMKLIGAVGERVNCPEVGVNFVEIDHRGDIRQFDTNLQNQPFDLRGVIVTAYSIEIDSNYIKFIGKVTLLNMDDLELPIYSLKMNHESGSIEEFYICSNEPESLDFFGWEIEIYNIKIEEDDYRLNAAIKIPEELKQALPGISGRFIEIDEFVISNSGQIKKLDVMIPYREEVSIGGGLSLIVKDLGTVIENECVENINLTLKFRQVGLILPEELGGGILLIDNLSINSDGEISYDKIHLNDQKVPFLDVAEIYVSSASLDKNGLSLRGSIKLGKAFPQGLEGQTFSIDDLYITGKGIERFDVGIDLTDPVQLFGAIEFSANKFSFSNTGFTVKGGQVKFINDLAKATTSKPVKLNTFRMNYSGQIEEFDAEFNNLEFDLLGCAINIDSLQFTSNCISVQGDVILPSQFPDKLSLMPIEIQKLEISYTGELLNYKVGIGNLIDFNLNGLKITFKEITIDKTGYMMDAICTIPNISTIPQSLRGLELVLNDFKINRDFKIVDFEITTSKRVDFNLNKLQFTVGKVTFTKNNMGFDGKIKLPDTYPGTLKNKEISFTNILMSYNG